MKKIFGLVFAIILFSFLIVPSSYAEFRLDPAKINLSVFEGVNYNSNPAYSNTHDRDHSFSNKLGADLGVEIPFGQLHRYTWNSNTSWVKNFEYSEYDQFNNVLNHALDLYFNNWSLNIHQNFANTSEPTLHERAILDRGFMRKISTTPGFDLQGDLGKVKLRTGFDYTYDSYNQAYKIMDADIFSPYVELAYELTPRIDGFGRFNYVYTNRRSSFMNDSNGYIFDTGIRGEITPYLVGEASVGYEILDFKKKTANSDTGDYSSVVFGGTLTNRLSKLTTQKIKFSYQPEQGYSNNSNYYKAISAEYSIVHKLNDRINLNGQADYMHTDEQGGTREKANIWSYGGGISFEVIKNLSLLADYLYSEKDSDRRGKGYKQHYASVSARYLF